MTAGEFGKRAQKVLAARPRVAEEENEMTSYFVACSLCAHASPSNFFDPQEFCHPYKRRFSCNTV